ncbi:hypothetical protein [Flavobacterium chilense]|uniref:Uncharacterized protein n=1 Tax=Flavobacterium chilense TaxID=946677 RepID=A0A1M6XMS7_9FLAO|nr:hypothetical protein [Flavobacterium chilense]SHL07095.1 hypothetical protein SAMN05444484_101196 [Flavobacterium chilense]
MNLKPFNFIVEEKLNLGEKITYEDELSSLEWQKKRLTILKRDSNICTNCLEVPTIVKNRIHCRESTEQEEKEQKISMRKAYDDLLPTIESIANALGLPIPEYTENLEYELKPADKPVILHVHHKYYIQTCRAWQYNDDALITLCSTCHQDTHDKNKIPVYSDESMTEQLNLTKCPKCNGSGYMDEYHYYLNGICFGCNGYKYLELIQ